MRLRSPPLLLLLAVALLGGARAATTPNPDFHASGGEAPERTSLEVDSPEVQSALRYMMTELRRLHNTYRYAQLKACLSADAGKANFGGRNIFLDVEFDMLKNQPSRHDIIIFKDAQGVITGMAIDEFPEVKFGPRPEPDVN
jgi:hypothetical protein